ncbi:conserved Plasmodium protein, unknown function [Plasmodium knowlesi strain H]|uniref:Zinc finger protein n=3 Tax=Plasmodium knowlesi TaxID=5850 RepID=A0A1A7VY17_PLAKH|nr:zinc finger protein, putative [Plasmodium knowlesi strain H]OTN66333.1 Uncharacterized protein PKNOH_S09541800 [Plasmodium knowlesi]CAA9989895.1 zinc finger protein, putative [Plasmodium knowlesi strain H]SBO24458.1 conserved Plasmodium protein, unknown function [Plasmodium knowlesi strain H]SBO26536.1 conserved Plasmodium protein, unknown function [Plasmodium knowlesi strain H]VVS79369.1 zinc finger protein, putative [Plasmodium knowlesi strain H]
MLRVETKTWTRDSHDLFDYEAQQVNKKSFLISTPIKLFRSKAQVSCVADNPHCLPNTAQDYLLSVRPEEGTDKYVITPAEHSLNNQYNVKKLWIIVKDLPDKSYALHENDIIKLGRFRLKVRQFIDSVDTLNSLKLDDSPSKKCESILDSSNIQCRICLIEGNQENDPLICPCDCKGSIKYAHLMCLRKWINGRLNLNDQLFSGSVFIKDICCELCKTKYPKSIKQNDELVQLVKIPNLKTPLIVLDNIIGQTSKGVHLISFADKKYLKLGRGHESDVRIPDVSISRYHATIKYEKGLFKLEDHNSKFGTLVALRKAREICPKDTMSLQVGRSVVNFRVDEEIPYKSGTIDIIENKEVIETNELPPANDKNNVNTPQISNPNLEEANRNNIETNHYVDLTNSTNSIQNSYSSYRVDNLMSLLNYQNEYRIFGIRNCYNLVDNRNGNQQNVTQMDCAGGNNINIEESNLHGGESNNNGGMIGEHMGVQMGIPMGLQMGVQMDLQMDVHMGLQLASEMGAQNNHPMNPGNDEERACSVGHRVQSDGDENDANNNGHDNGNNNNDDDDVVDDDDNGDNSNDDEGDDMSVHNQEDDDDDDENGSGTNNTGSSGGNSGGTSGGGSTGGNSNGNDGRGNEHGRKNSNQSSNDSIADNNDSNQGGNVNYHGNISNGIETSTPTRNIEMCNSTSYNQIVENEERMGDIRGDRVRANKNEVGTYCVNMPVQGVYINRNCENVYDNCKGTVPVVTSKFDNVSFFHSASDNGGSYQSRSYPCRSNMGKCTEVCIEDNYFFHNESKTPQQVDYHINSGTVNDMLKSNSSTRLEKNQDAVMNNGYHNEDSKVCSFVQSVYPIKGKNDCNVVNVMYNGSDGRVNHNNAYVGEAYIESRKYLNSVPIQSNGKEAGNSSSSSSCSSGARTPHNFLNEVNKPNNGSIYNSCVNVFPSLINLNNCSVNFESDLLPEFVGKNSFFVHDLGDNRLNSIVNEDKLNKSSRRANDSSGVMQNGVDALKTQPPMHSGSNDSTITSEGKEFSLKNKMKKGNLQRKSVILSNLKRKNTHNKKLRRSVNNSHVETIRQQYIDYSNKNNYCMNPYNSGCVDGARAHAEATYYNEKCSLSKYAESDFLENSSSPRGISEHRICGQLSLTTTLDSPSPGRGRNNYYCRKEPYNEESPYNEVFYDGNEEDYKFGCVKGSYNRGCHVGNSGNDQSSSGGGNNGNAEADTLVGNSGIGDTLHLKQYPHRLDYYNGMYGVYNVAHFNEKFSVHGNTSPNHLSRVNCGSNKFSYHTQGTVMRSGNVKADFLLNNCSMGACPTYFNIPVAFNNKYVTGSGVFFMNTGNSVKGVCSGSNYTGNKNQQNRIHKDDKGEERTDCIVEASRNYGTYINGCLKAGNGEQRPTDDNSSNVGIQFRYENNNITGDYKFHLKEPYSEDVVRSGGGKEDFCGGCNYALGDMVQAMQTSQLDGYSQGRNVVDQNGCTLSKTRKDLFSKKNRYINSGSNIHCNRGSGGKSVNDTHEYTQETHSCYRSQMHKKINPRIRKNDKKVTNEINKNQNDRSGDNNIRKVKNGKRLNNRNDKCQDDGERFQNRRSVNKVGSKIALESSTSCDEGKLTYCNNTPYKKDIISVNNVSKGHLGFLHIAMDNSHVKEADIVESHRADFSNIHAAGFIPNGGIYFHAYNTSGIPGHPNVTLSIINNHKTLNGDNIYRKEEPVV